MKKWKRRLKQKAKQGLTQDPQMSLPAEWTVRLKQETAKHWFYTISTSEAVSAYSAMGGPYTSAKGAFEAACRCAWRYDHWSGLTLP